MIAERNLISRLLSKLIYDKAAEQIYTNKHMIKNLPTDKVVNTVINRLWSYKNFLCTDINSYDAS